MGAHVGAGFVLLGILVVSAANAILFTYRFCYRTPYTSMPTLAAPLVASGVGWIAFLILRFAAPSRWMFELIAVATLLFCFTGFIVGNVPSKE